MAGGEGGGGGSKAFTSLHVSVCLTPSEKNETWSVPLRKTLKNYDEGTFSSPCSIHVKIL